MLKDTPTEKLMDCGRSISETISSFGALGKDSSSSVELTTTTRVFVREWTLK
jgi:hypothetical protein